MNTQTFDKAPHETERVEAFYTNVKRLGHWTDARTIDVTARRGSVQLDLRSAQIPEGDIEVRITGERSILKLLVPDGAVVDERELAYEGRSEVKDAQRHSASGGRRLKLTGVLKRSEVRIVRGGVATLTAMFSREFVEDCRTAHRNGTLPTVHAPESVREGTPREAD
ncbi:hypothetical protein QCN29_19020 [Streptomyces sp. HNM0663]|uniref:SRPBCC family protein n=1 Tax=Streptomyces chengmaiensis TaxID=3040919 RepID=A0ABT6HQ69_9ACTN|nr:hypothetical protein [Streptomyces chengmaiensis]MDH2390846.1 hypothetical protein [Streptomyces chengmaiensis]